MAIVINNLMPGLSNSATITSRHNETRVFHSFGFRILWSISAAVIVVVISTIITYDLLIVLRPIGMASVAFASCAWMIASWFVWVSRKYLRCKSELVMSHETKTCEICQTWPRIVKKKFHVSNSTVVLHPLVGEFFQSRVVGYAVLLWVDGDYFPIHSGRKRVCAESIVAQMKDLGFSVSDLDGRAIISTYSFT